MEITDLIQNRKQFVEAQIKNGFDLTTVLVGLYSDASHFVYEILQNAEDAKATEIKFHLEADKLIITHNGIPFSNEDIEAITGISNIQNDKKKNLEKIGKFGIGFKSVYAVTDSPRIQSGNFDFEIINFVLPDKFSDNNNFSNTTITLSFKHPKRSEDEIFELIKNKFEIFEFYNLLFLTHLKTITLEWEDQRKHFAKKEKLINGSDIAYESAIMVRNEKYEYLVFKTDVQNKAFSKLKNKPKLAIAFKVNTVDKQLEIVKADSSNLFVFFETGYETFLNFILQAPFTTTPARDNIDFKLPVNLELIEELCSLMGNVLEYFRSNKLITVNFLNQLPIKRIFDDSKLVYRKFFETVKNELSSDKRYLPSMFKNQYQAASDLAIVRGRELTSVISKVEDLQMLFDKKYWMDTKITVDRSPDLFLYLTKVLNISEYTPDDFARKITEEFLKSKPDKWMQRFYEFLNGKQESLWRIGRGRDEGILRKKPIIRLKNGGHTAPFGDDGKPKVFLPIKKVQAGYDTISPGVIQSKASLEFIKNKLGIKEPDLIDEIRQHIIPLYKLGGSKFPDLKSHLKHVDLILDVYDRSNNVIKLELIEMLKSEGVYFFYVINLSDSKNFWGKGIDCYFQNENLKEYFRFSENIYLLNDKVYPSTSLKLLHEIALKCGMKNYPNILNVDTYISDEKKRQLRISAYRSDEITWAHGDRVTDFTLHGFNDIVNQEILSKKDSVLIWSMLLNFLKNELKSDRLFRGQYWWFRNNDRYAYFPSDILLKMIKTAWLYSKDDICLRPSDIVISNLSQEYDTNSEEAILLISKLQFKTEAEEIYLNQIPEDKRNELLEAAELIRLSKEYSIDYKTFLLQKLGEEKRAQYQAELDEAPDYEDVIPSEIDFSGFDNSEVDVSYEEPSIDETKQEDSHETTEKDEGNTEPDETPPNSNIDNQLPQDIKNKIGFRGERIVWLQLKKKWIKKHELIKETEFELEFKDVDGDTYKLIHLNDAERKGYGCDILIKKNEENYKYIEVKSTKNKGKEYYSVSGFQWALAHKNYNQSIGNNYWIYVVTDVLSHKPIITPIENPIKKWKDGKLKANPVNIEL